MKKVILLYCICILSIKCNKHKDPITIKEVTDVQWQFFALQEHSDPSINPLPAPSYFKLSSDQTFEATMGSSTCKGTYLWTQVDSVNANVNFTIESWFTTVSDTVYLNRLKKVLAGIGNCHYLKPPYLLPVPSYLNPVAMELQFDGSIGYFYVFKL